jgi:hypothetical protein
MNSETADRLRGIVASLNEHIDVLRACGLSDARQLLSIAKLDLQMRIHGISDEELRAFCEALEMQDRPNLTAEILAFRPRKKNKSSA